MLKLFRLLAAFRGAVALVLVLALAQSIGFLLLPRLMSDIGGIVLALSEDTRLVWVLIAMPLMAAVFGVIIRAAVPLSQAVQAKIDRPQWSSARG